MQTHLLLLAPAAAPAPVPPAPAPVTTVTAATAPGGEGHQGKKQIEKFNNVEDLLVNPNAKI